MGRGGNIIRAEGAVIRPIINQAEGSIVSSKAGGYLDLPDTPLRPSLLDQSLARKLHQQAVPLPLVEAALLLATLRRRSRPADLPPLPKIRSLAYFLPVIEELQRQPLAEMEILRTWRRTRRFRGLGVVTTRVRGQKS